MMKKEDTNVELVSILILVFVLIAFCVSLFYYGVMHLTGTARSGSDIANIFVASATLLGPLILFFTFNSWKEQYNKTSFKELSVKAVQELITVKSQLEMADTQYCQMAGLKISDLSSGTNTDLYVMGTAINKAQEAFFSLDATLATLNTYQNGFKLSEDFKKLFNAIVANFNKQLIISMLDEYRDLSSYNIMHPKNSPVNHNDPIHSFREYKMGKYNEYLRFQISWLIKAKYSRTEDLTRIKQDINDMVENIIEAAKA
jgi:hypothetical protein